jgi:uncharacterized protein (DUF952 family)
VRLFHLTTESEWAAAKVAGEYQPRGFEREGFVHCSYAHQVHGVANRLFRGRRDLVLLEIDPALLGCPVIDENLEGGAQLFPHAYGTIPVSAIRQVHAFPCAANGSFPAELTYNPGLPR